MLEVILQKVGDVACSFAAGLSNISGEWQQTHLDRFTRSFQNGPDSTEALFQDSLQGNLETAGYMVPARLRLEGWHGIPISSDPHQDCAGKNVKKKHVLVS